MPKARARFASAYQWSEKEEATIMLVHAHSANAAHAQDTERLVLRVMANWCLSSEFAISDSRHRYCDLSQRPEQQEHGYICSRIIYSDWRT
jgi:hypothetical protein